MSGLPALRVVAGALVDARGRVLIAQRPAGKAFAGRWEFPGGKRLAHETARDALNRELLEELGIQVAKARPLITVRHQYAPDTAPVEIECWVVEAWRGDVAPLDAQELRWCEREALSSADILEADRGIVTALRLPATFVRVEDPETLAERLPGPRGRDRVAWVVSGSPADVGVLRRLREHGDQFFVLDPQAPPGEWAGRVYSRPHAAEHAPGDTELVGRVCADAREALAAAHEGADFLLLPDRNLATADLDALAALGTPFYVNVATAGPAASAATGRLWWKSPPGGGTLDRL